MRIEHWNNGDLTLYVYMSGVSFIGGESFFNSNYKYDHALAHVRRILAGDSEEGSKSWNQSHKNN